KPAAEAKSADSAGSEGGAPPLMEACAKITQEAAHDGGRVRMMGTKNLFVRVPARSTGVAAARPFLSCCHRRASLPAPARHLQLDPTCATSTRTRLAGAG